MTPRVTPDNIKSALATSENKTYIPKSKIIALKKAGGLIRRSLTQSSISLPEARKAIRQMGQKKFFNNKFRELRAKNSLLKQVRQETQELKKTSREDLKKEKLIEERRIRANQEFRRKEIETTDKKSENKPAQKNVSSSPQATPLVGRIEPDDSSKAKAPMNQYQQYQKESGSEALEAEVKESLNPQEGETSHSADEADDLPIE